MSADGIKKSSPAAVALAWTIVVLPTLWGLNFTVQNALKLFLAPAATATAPAVPAVAPATPSATPAH